METGTLTKLAPLQFGQPFSPFNAVESRPAIQSLTNAQKLSLAPNTAVGTQVSVTNGFVVSGFGDARDGFYFPLPGVADTYVKSLPFVGGGLDIQAFKDDSNIWSIGLPASPAVADTSGETYPWEATWTTAGCTLTHPVLQQLTTPSSAQGGVAVLGGTQDGVWTDRGDINVGKKTFVFLGDSGGDNSVNIIKWVTNLSDEGATPAAAGFVIKDSGGAGLYYSLSDVATPDLATNWKNASDDSPASITVTTFTQGQLVSGWKLGEVTYQVNGNQNGRNLYSDVLGVAPNLGWNTADWSDGITTGAHNTAFPDIGTADPVASENNWEVVTP